MPTENTPRSPSLPTQIGRVGAVRLLWAFAQAGFKYVARALGCAKPAAMEPQKVSIVSAGIAGGQGRNADARFTSSAMSLRCRSSLPRRRRRFAGRLHV